MEQYIEKDGKRLRLGYTTGSLSGYFKDCVVTPPRPPHGCC